MIAYMKKDRWNCDLVWENEWNPHTNTISISKNEFRGAKRKLRANKAKTTIATKINKIEKLFIMY